MAVSMHRIFQDFIDDLVESSDELAFSNAMSRAAAALELSSFAYLCVPHRRDEQARLISTYPRPWTTHYMNNHYERLDPVIRQALQVTEPFEWGKSIESRKLSYAQYQLFEEAATFGIRYGLTIPIHDGRGPVAAVTFASDDQSPAFRHCVEAHRRVLQLMRCIFTPAPAANSNRTGSSMAWLCHRASTSAWNGRRQASRRRISAASWVSPVARPRSISTMLGQSLGFPPCTRRFHDSPRRNTHS
jgi:hypothetical protein